jgi:hypothetical protein
LNIKQFLFLLERCRAFSFGDEPPVKVSLFCKIDSLFLLFFLFFIFFEESFMSKLISALALSAIIFVPFTLVNIKPANATCHQQTGESNGVKFFGIHGTDPGICTAPVSTPISTVVNTPVPAPISTATAPLTARPVNAPNSYNNSSNSVSSANTNVINNNNVTNRTSDYNLNPVSVNTSACRDGAISINPAYNGYALGVSAAYVIQLGEKPSSCKDNVNDLENLRHQHAVELLKLQQAHELKVIELSTPKYPVLPVMPALDDLEPVAPRGVVTRKQTVKG